MRFIKCLIILLLCFSCNNKEMKREKNKYQILNLIYSDYSKHQMEFFVFPTKPSNLNIDYSRVFELKDTIYADSTRNVLTKKINKKDSIKRIKNYLSNKKNRQIFAINSKMYKYHSLKDKKINIKGFEDLYKRFVVLEKIDSLNIHKILSKNNDSLNPFNESLLKNNTGADFGRFNVLISFSNISFNNDYTKAIILGTRSFSGTDSHSLIYFLEKQNGKWEKKFKQSL